MMNDEELTKLCGQMPVFSTQLLQQLLERIDKFGKKALNIREAAEYMGCSPSYVRQLANNGLLAKCKPVFSDINDTKKGRTSRVFFLREDLDAFMTRYRIPSKYEVDQAATDYVLNNRK